MRASFLILTLATSISTFAGDFIGLGETGRTGIFQSVLTVFKDGLDPQPRCPGCLTIRAIYDGKFEQVGNTQAKQLSYRIVDNDGQVAQASKVLPLAAIWRHRNSPTMAKVSLGLHSYFRNLDQLTLELDFEGPRCQNPYVKECQELISIDSFEINIKEIFSLNFINSKDEGFPNLIQN